MTEAQRFHLICERDVGLFSLIQQVIANVPWALREDRIPVAFFGANTCYWTPNGYRGRHTVWEYYFQPLIPGYPAATVPEPIRRLISADRPSPDDVGGFVADAFFASRHFGDHPRLSGMTLPIPYRWDDPDDALRWTASSVDSPLSVNRLWPSRGPRSTGTIALWNTG